MTAPVNAQAPVTTGSWARTNAATTHPQSASRMSASEPDASVSTPMISHSPTRLPDHHEEVGPADPLGLVELGDLRPPAWRRAPRGVTVRNPFCGRAIRSVSGSMHSIAADGSGRSAPCRCRAPDRRTATARSTPTTAASAATAAATSRSVRVTGAEEEARRKSRSTGVPSAAVSMVVSGSGPRGRCRRPATPSTARRSPSTVASPTWSPLSSSSRLALGRRVTSAASRLGPQRPAATTSGTLTPACAARRVR